MDHILSDLSTMTHPYWVALHGMAHSFIELAKAVVHVIRLVLWFSFCLPCDGEGKRNPSKTIGVAREYQRVDTLKPYSQKTSQSKHTRTTALSNSMKLSHARGATQDRQVMVERSDRMWSKGEGNGKPLQYS